MAHIASVAVSKQEGPRTYIDRDAMGMSIREILCLYT